MKVKIIGAGSIGNHLAQAARRMGWDVSVVDADTRALDRMRNQIYPSRYGPWDEGIALYTLREEPKENFDIIMVGTPPDTHIPIAREMLKEQPRILHIEKPLCTPDPNELDVFIDDVQHSPHTMVTVGYDHSVSESVEYVVGLLRNKAIGNVLAIDVEFREHWKGIFSAHPWLSGPADSYLGYWRRGGGAGGEHSHALHLWRYLAREAGWLGPITMKSLLDMRREGLAEYDEAAAFLFGSTLGGMGRVIQDVVTDPVKKNACIQGDAGRIEWYCNGAPEGDVVHVWLPGQKMSAMVFAKTRRDDFFREMLHYKNLLNGAVDYRDSPLAFKRGMDVMEMLQKAYRI